MEKFSTKSKTAESAKIKELVQSEVSMTQTNFRNMVLEQCKILQSQEDKTYLTLQGLLYKNLIKMLEPDLHDSSEQDILWIMRRIQKNQWYSQDKEFGKKIAVAINNYAWVFTQILNLPDEISEGFSQKILEHGQDKILSDGDRKQKVQQFKDLLSWSKKPEKIIQLVIDKVQQKFFANGSESIQDILKIIDDDFGFITKIMIRSKYTNTQHVRQTSDTKLAFVNAYSKDSSKHSTFNFVEPINVKIPTKSKTYKLQPDYGNTIQEVTAPHQKKPTNKENAQAISLASDFIYFLQNSFDKKDSSPKLPFQIDEQIHNLVTELMKKPELSVFKLRPYLRLDKNFNYNISFNTTFTDSLKQGLNMYLQMIYLKDKNLYRRIYRDNLKQADK